MPDEDIRELERKAVNASPEVVAWLRALTRQGALPKIPEELKPGERVIPGPAVRLVVGSNLSLHVEQDGTHVINLDVGSVFREIIGRLKHDSYVANEAIDAVVQNARMYSIFRDRLMGMLAEFMPPITPPGDRRHG